MLSLYFHFPLSADMALTQGETQCPRRSRNVSLMQPRREIEDISSGTARSKASASWSCRPGSRATYFNIERRTIAAVAPPLASTARFHLLSRRATRPRSFATRSRRDAIRLREKRDLRNAPTVGDLLDAYLGSDRFKANALSTQKTDRGRAERHLRPLLARRHIDGLTPDDIRAHLRRHSRRENRRHRADKQVRHRARQRRRGHRHAWPSSSCGRLSPGPPPSGSVKINPCDGVSFGPSGVRETILESADDYARLFGALDRIGIREADPIGGSRRHQDHHSDRRTPRRNHRAAVAARRFAQGQDRAAARRPQDRQTHWQAARDRPAGCGTGDHRRDSPVTVTRKRTFSRPVVAQDASTSRGRGAECARRRRCPQASAFTGLRP